MSDDTQETRRVWLQRVALGTVAVGAAALAGNVLIPRQRDEPKRKGNIVIMPKKQAREIPPPRAVQVIIGGGMRCKPALEGVPPEEFDPSGMYREILANFPHIKKVVSITCTSPLKEENEYEAEKQHLMWPELGVEKITTISSRAQADEFEKAQAIAEADLVVIIGGKQDIVTDALLGTKSQRALEKRLHDPKFVFAGTSAGAACMSEIMINGGRQVGYVYPEPPKPKEDRRPVLEQMRPGLNVFPAIVDTHFSNRNRVERLEEALRAHPGRLGIGVDEETALVLEKSEMRVLGKGRVLLARVEGLAGEKGRMRQQWLAGPAYVPPKNTVHEGTYFLADNECWNIASRGFNPFEGGTALPGLVASSEGVRAP